MRAGDGQTCGKILSRCNGLVQSFREKIGTQICIFKIGVTSNPLLRFLSYTESGYQLMWLMHQSPSLDLIHMLEAALIMANCHHSGCRNAKDSGGEGGLNRAKKLPPPLLCIYHRVLSKPTSKSGMKKCCDMLLKLWQTMPHCTACTSSCFTSFVASTENSKELGSLVLMMCFRQGLLQARRESCQR